MAISLSCSLVEVTPLLIRPEDMRCAMNGANGSEDDMNNCNDPGVVKKPTRKLCYEVSTFLSHPCGVALRGGEHLTGNSFWKPPTEACTVGRHWIVAKAR